MLIIEEILELLKTDRPFDNSRIAEMPSGAKLLGPIPVELQQLFMLHIEYRIMLDDKIREFEQSCPNHKEGEDLSANSWKLKREVGRLTTLEREMNRCLGAEIRRAFKKEGGPALIGVCREGVFSLDTTAFLGEIGITIGFSKVALEPNMTVAELLDKVQKIKAPKKQ